MKMVISNNNKIVISISCISKSTLIGKQVAESVIILKLSGNSINKMIVEKYKNLTFEVNILNYLMRAENYCVKRN